MSENISLSLLASSLDPVTTKPPTLPGAIGQFYKTWVYPRVKHLITVCTGSGLAAQAEVLDGKRATSNKKVLKEIMSLRPQVHWASHASWVTDGSV